MLRPFSRRAFLSALAATCASHALAAPLERSLRPRLRGQRATPDPQELISAAKLGGHVQFQAADLRTGRVLEAGGTSTALPPASVTKVLTALYALDTFGPSHRFETRLMATGPISNGRLNGDLILVGGGDPTLSTRGLAALARALKQAGLREITGAFRVFDAALPRVKTIDPEQPDHVSYSPAIAGIALNFNRVHFEWARSAGAYSVMLSATDIDYKPAVYSSEMRIVDRQAPVYTYANAQGKDVWSVARSALGRGGGRWLPVRNPALYSGDVFQTLARSHGIPLPAPTVMRRPPQGTRIAQVRSEKLIEILREMLKYSTNITAEMVGLSATTRRLGRVPRNLKASATEMNRWATDRFDTGGFRLHDHSGLGGGSRLSAAAMCAALIQAHRNAELRPLLKGFLMRDAQGRPNKAHPVKVVAKTGTLNFVSSLAGYARAADGSDIAFAIFAANLKERRKIKKSEREGPPGARAWNRRAKGLQQKLIERWATLLQT